MLVRSLLMLVMVFAWPAAFAEGPPKMDMNKSEERPTAGGDRRIERLEDKIEDQKKELSKKRGELAKIEKELAKPERPAVNLPKNAKASPGAADFGTNSQKREELKIRREELKSEIADLKEEIERSETKLDRMEVAAEQPKKPAICENCESKKAAPNQGKSGWEGFAEVLKAATPLGLGGMNTWLGYQGVKAQSSDYNLYANSMMSQGLPIQPNTNSYSSTIGSAASANSMLMSFLNGGNSSTGMNSGFGTGAGFGIGMSGFGGMNMMMPSMYGSGYGYGFPSYGMSYSPAGYGQYAYNNLGSAYMSPASAYGSNAFGYNGMSYYNPFGSAYYGQYNASGLNSFYQNQLMQSQASVYSAQQRALLGQDAQIAQQSLGEAYSRYNYVMQQMGGSTSGYYTIGTAGTAATGTFNTSAVPSFTASATRY